MSIINQMLQELEQRHAKEEAGAARVRAVRPVARSNMAVWWLGVALLMLLAAAGGYWLLVDRADGRLAAPLPAVTPVSTPLPPSRPAAPPSALQMDADINLALVQQPVEPARQATVTTEAPRAIEPPKAAKKSPEPPPVAEIGKEIKQLSPRQRADNAYRQAYAALQQGRVAEAEDGLREALQQDPRHDAARQALVALLVDARQLQRAEQALRQGLELQPGNGAYAMTLARLQVELGDGAAALATLQRNPPVGENAEYHGFMAALLQRAERHKDAIEQYQSALRINPASGPWWLGLGVSLQADNQPAKAADAFRRARQSSTLSPELQAFAEQRLKQLP